MRRFVQLQSREILRSYPRLRGAPLFDLQSPAAASVTVSSNGYTGTTTSATYDTTSATVQGAHSEGGEHLTVAASTAWVRGKRYLVVADGHRFLVRCSRTVTGTTLSLGSPLPVDVASGSTVSGYEVSYQLPTAAVANVGAGIVRWSVDLDGQSYEWHDEFKVSRRIPQWPLDGDELTRRFPEILAQRDSLDGDLEETIEAALEEELLPRLEAKGIEQENIISSWSLIPAHVAAVRLFVARDSRSASPERREELRKNLEDVIQRALDDQRAWYDAPETSDPSPGGTSAGEYGSLRYSR